MLNDTAYLNELIIEIIERNLRYNEPLHGLLEEYKSIYPEIKKIFLKKCRDFVDTPTR